MAPIQLRCLSNQMQLAERAEAVARSIAELRWLAKALGEVARGLAETNPERARQLVTETEAVARSITALDLQSLALRE